VTIEQMRAALGLGPEYSDAAVLAAWEASGLDYAYLTQEEYLERFGRQEAVFLTDEAKTGDPDSTKIETAISDATEIVDGYIGLRYPRPIRDVPRLLKGIVAALARETLHTTRATLAVTQNADRARAQLKDIQSGKLSLPIAEGQLAPVQLANGPGSTGDPYRSVYGSDGLDRYMSLSGGGFIPCWRR
jgi:phage gp36-like protein